MDSNTSGSEESEKINLRLKREPSPNISMNLGIMRSSLELYLAAIIGVIVQLSIVAVSGYSAYYPKWNSKKGGATSGKHAFPVMATGAALLCLGVGKIQSIKKVPLLSLFLPRDVFVRCNNRWRY